MAVTESPRVRMDKIPLHPAGQFPDLSGQLGAARLRTAVCGRFRCQRLCRNRGPVAALRR